MKFSPRFQVLAAFGLLTAFVAGCRFTENLITDRRSFDRFQDRRKQAIDRLNLDIKFLNEANKATEDASLDPYPQLGSQIDTMKHSLKLVDEDQGHIEQFKKRYDAFAAGRAEISSDDTQDWERLRGLHSEFGAIAQAMNNDFAQFDQAGNNFGNLLNQYHVEKIQVADLNKEFTGLADKARDAAHNMDQRVDADRKALDFGKNNGLSPVALQHKSEILDKMRGMLPQFRLMSDTLTMSTGQVSQALQGQTLLWTGPGMAGNTSKLIGDLRGSRDTFWKNKKEFDDLAARFDAPDQAAAAPGSPTAQTR
jgi:hypothetical protein